MADPRGDTSPVGPVTSCLVNEIHWRACQIAGEMAAGRIDPPLLLQIDEAAKTCPGLPIPSLLADSSGRGVLMQIAVQGLAQIEEVWGKPATRIVLDTSNQVYVSGIADPDTLKMVSELCDTATFKVRGKDGETADYPVATPGMIRRLPKRRALVLRGDLAPVIVHLPMAWRDWRYRLARLRGNTIAQLHYQVSAGQVLTELAPQPAAADAPSDALQPDERAVYASLGAPSRNGHGEPAALYPWDEQ
jgi:hypothetical protein